MATRIAPRQADWERLASCTIHPSLSQSNRLNEDACAIEACDRDPARWQFTCKNLLNNENGDTGAQNCRQQPNRAELFAPVALENEVYPVKAAKTNGKNERSEVGDVDECISGCVKAHQCQRGRRRKNERGASARIA